MRYLNNHISLLSFILLSGILFMTVSCGDDDDRDITVLSWEKRFGGADVDFAYSVLQSVDGNYMLAGGTDSYGAGMRDIYLVKIDSYGNKVWVKTFGGIKSDSARSIKQTLDGGFIIAGWTKSYGSGSYDIYLVKTDNHGNKEWDKTFGGKNADFGSSVQQTSDGGYIIVGQTYYDSHPGSTVVHNTDIYLVKTDRYGNKIWDKTFGGEKLDTGTSVQQTSDNGYIVAGTFDYLAYNYIYLVKTNIHGDIIWEKSFKVEELSFARSVQQTSDNGFIITGGTGRLFLYSGDVILIKTDQDGNLEWQKTYGTERGADVGNSVQQTSDGGYIIGGEGAGEKTWDMYLIKTDDLGNLTWEKKYGETDADFGLSVQQTFDGGYILAGQTHYLLTDLSDVYLIKTDANGNIQQKITE